MYSFRFNPIAKRWVMIGTALPQTVQIESGNLIISHKDNQFLAATHPRHPFVLEPTDIPKHTERLHVDLPPVGEYELLLYQGKTPLQNWKASEWEGWLILLHHRLQAARHNPYLHHTSLLFDLSLLDSISGYQRVGELIVSSHPILGEEYEVPTSLITKILDQEPMYTVYETKSGAWHVPSAPLHPQEMWYLPKEAEASIEQNSKADRQACAESLSLLMPVLFEEYPHSLPTLRIHTSITSEDASSWWMQLYVAENPHLLPIVPNPEKLVRTLRLRLPGN